MHRLTRCLFLFVLIPMSLLKPSSVKAQYISLYGVNISHILTGSNFDPGLLSASGGELTYNNYLGFGFNYNAGAEYLRAPATDVFLLQTGFSRTLTSPSSFSHAKNKESVSMTTNNWLTSVDLNLYDGFSRSGAGTWYVFSVQPSYSFAYALGSKKNFYVGGTFGINYTLIPQADTKSSVSIPLKAGIKIGL